MILTYLWPWNKVKVIKPGYEPLDPEQGCNQAKFQRPPLNSVCQKASVKGWFFVVVVVVVVVVKLENTSVICLECV